MPPPGCLLVVSGQEVVLLEEVSPDPVLATEFSLLVGDLGLAELHGVVVFEVSSLDGLQVRPQKAVVGVLPLEPNVGRHLRKLRVVQLLKQVRVLFC